MKKTCWILGIAALAILIAVTAGRSTTSGTASAQENAMGETAIKIDNFTFSPATMTIHVGDTVRWTNHDDLPHNVVSEGKTFKSKTLDTDENFSYTFTKAGAYSYYCSIHPKMTGKIVVQ
ncbi:MAG TPA: cupredoxin family copper-binding protein [Candidatus Angelobacter sp.]|nr:cupredoxin family copper-binding protein [Candidatus Angelobacter sp.]